MLPGPPLQPPPLPPVLIGLPSVPTPSPSVPPSLSIGSSLAIVAIIIFATALVTICIVLLRRGCRRRHLSCSTLSPLCSFSPMTSFSSSESGLQSGASAAVCASSPGGRAGMSLLEMAMVPSARKEAGKVPASAYVSHSAEGPVMGTELATFSSVKAVMGMSGVDTLVPLAPPLPEVERLLLELLSLHAPMPGRITVCLICNLKLLPTDAFLVLPVCSHVFHQSCIVAWLRRTTPPCCPSCQSSITIPGPDKTNFCSDEDDIESQMLVPAPPGEEVAESVGGSRGWLRTSLDIFSGSLMGCSSNCATAVAVPVSSQRTTGWWSLGSSGRLENDSYRIKGQMTPSFPPDEEMFEAVRSSRGWLRSSLATLLGGWDDSDAMVLPVYSKQSETSETLGSSGDSRFDSWSKRWDLEAATSAPEKPSMRDYVRWFVIRSSG